MANAEEIPSELQYVVLLFLLFVVPRFFQRWRLPAAVTSMGLGALAGMGLGLFAQDQTIRLLSTLGIVSLFLFAGLDVNFRELRQEATVVAQHLVIRVIVVLAVTIVVSLTLGLEVRPAILVALALLTPSTGFILDSLASLGVTERERFWIKTKAIATEIVALGLLFLTLQSTTPARLGLSTMVLLGLIGVLPVVFRAFARLVVPYAPRSEFAFLLMIALLCAYATRELGVYYLVGAFVVGLTAQRLRERLPAMTSEQMLHAVELFASFFVPFYFFHAGLQLLREDFGLKALVLGGIFLVALVPFRLGLVGLHRRLALGEPVRKGVRVGASLLPTLVFTLVIAEILRDRFGVPAYVFGGLIVYAIVNTLIPGFALRLPPPEFEILHAQEVPVPGESLEAGEIAAESTEPVA
ncbi:MAG TPA: cation:proton antiporter [Gemmatimonadales bacterium]